MSQHRNTTRQQHHTERNVTITGADSAASFLDPDSPIPDAITAATDRTLKRAYITLGEYVAQTDADTDVQQTSLTILQTADRNDFFPGRNLDVCVLSALFLAFRIHHEARAISELIDLIPESSEVLSRYNSALQKRLDLPVPPAHPTVYLDRFASNLDAAVPQDVTNTIAPAARELLENTDEQYISGRDPTALTAAAIYAACLLTRTKITQQTISQELGTSTVTIRNSYNDFIEQYQDNPDTYSF